MSWQYECRSLGGGWSRGFFGVLAVGSVGVPMFATLHNDHHYIG